ncbi:MAG: DMT family transporter [Chitinivibrionales bacterium]|nr:DMT family transporter [Chitinivibrionales bacterium]
MHQYLGETAALLTAMSWTVTALAFERASRSSSAITVNVVRTVLAIFFLAGYTWISRGSPFPYDATGRIWFWLSLSGFVGFFLGDICLFKSYTLISARVAMLVGATAPVIGSILGWLVLNENLSSQEVFGMILTLAGICLVILKPASVESGKRTLSHSPAGLLLAFGAAVGQAGGLLLSKLGVRDYDPFAATQIRLIAAAPFFLILATVMKSWPTINAAIRRRTTMTQMTTGAVFGPFIGVSFSLMAVKYTSIGVASTIMALVPVFIIAPSAILFKEKISGRDILGTIIAISGVGLMFL